MTKTETVDVQIEYVRRLGCSQYGNPYFSVGLTYLPEDMFNTFHALRTSIDSAVNYEISNYRRGDTARLFLTKAGRIYGIERITCD
jgi:hypothetical protein